MMLYDETPISETPLKTLDIIGSKNYFSICIYRLYGDHNFKLNIARVKATNQYFCICESVIEIP